MFFFYNYKIVSKINSIILLYAILPIAICFITKCKNYYIYLIILILLIILRFIKYYIYNFIILKNNLIYFLPEKSFLKGILLLF